MIEPFVMLAEMQKCGLSNSEVASRLGKRPSVIEYWKANHIPRADNYLRLLMLYCDVVRPNEIRVLVSTDAYKLVVTPAMV